MCEHQAQIISDHAPSQWELFQIISLICIYDRVSACVVAAVALCLVTSTQAVQVLVNLVVVITAVAVSRSRSCRL